MKQSSWRFTNSQPFGDQRSRAADGDKPKQIIFVKDLVDKIISGKVQATYRKSPKMGTYYVIENRFKQKPESSKDLDRVLPDRQN